MPFTFTNKAAGDLIRSQDWNAAMAAIADLFDKFNFDATLGHTHNGGPEEGPQIGTAGLQDAAVTLQKLADFAVSAAKLQNNAVTNSKIANGAVTGDKIADGSISGNKLANLTVTGTQIANGTITGSKIASSSITSTQLGPNSVGNSEIQNNSINSLKLASNSVGNSEIQNGSVTANKLANGVAPEIGVAISRVGDGGFAAVPSGFLTSECQFVCSLKYLQINLNGSGSQIVNATINSSTREVTITSGSSSGGFAQVLAIGKKGGW